MSAKAKPTSKLIDVSELQRGPPGSRKTPTPTKEWVRRLLAIPEGKAMVIEDQHEGVASTLAARVREYAKKGLIPEGYWVTQRKKGEGKYTVYVAHSKREEAV